MTYLKWRDADGYEKGCRECLDLSAFAADLCKALDGKPISTNDRDGYATFKLADGCKLSLSKGWRSTEIDKVAVHIDPPDELDRLRGYDLSIEYRLPASVTVSAKLSLDKIVADIKGRLITPAQAPLANLREFAKQLERDGRPLEMIGRAYAAQFPELEITVPELSDHRGSIRGSAPIYLLGDFYSDGCVSIERMELTRAQFERVVRCCAKENEGRTAQAVAPPCRDRRIERLLFAGWRD